MFKAAVIGAGPRGQEHIRALQQVEDMEVVAVADIDSTALEKAKQTCSITGFSSCESLMQTARPDIIVLATPPEVRLDVCQQILRDSFVRAVVVEKPLALSLAEARQMQSACQQAGAQLVVCHQLRFCPEFSRLKKAVDEGELGKIERVYATCYGNLLNQGPHLLDAVSWFCGDRRPLWVQAAWCDEMGTLRRICSSATSDGETDLAHPAPRWMTATIAFEGGVRATVEMGALYHRSRTFVDDWLQKRLTLVGEKGHGEAQVAGYVKWAGAGGFHQHSSNLQAYMDATRAFHQELKKSLQNGVDHCCSAERAMASVELIAACAQSAVDQRPISWPLATGRDGVRELASLLEAPSADSSNWRSSEIGQSRRLRVFRPDRERDRQVAASRQQGPEFSVILPLQDHRGLAADCLRSWTQRQTFAGHRFEVILLSDGSEPELEAEMRLLLREQDRLIIHDTKVECELYDLGARQAGGELLLFTEPHCIAEPDCLAELEDFFSRENYDGACLRSTLGNPRTLARMERRMYEEGFAAWSRPGDWRKVILRGFAISRRAYLDVGGYDWRFGRFAEWALAAALHRRGYRLGYASAASVIHHDTTSFGELFPAVFDFAQGECAYRDQHDPQDCQRYFDQPAIWNRRRGLHPDAARISLHCASNSAWSNLFTNQRERRRLALRMLGEMFRSVPTAVFGVRAHLAMAKLALLASRLRRRLPQSEESRYRSYLYFWRCMTHYAYIDYFRRAAHPPTSKSDVQPLGHSTWSLAAQGARPIELCSIPDQQLIGFHARETHQGRWFRWSQPMATILLPLDSKDCHITLDTRSVRGSTRPQGVAFYINGQRIESVEQHADGKVTLKIESSMLVARQEQFLTLVCPPLSKNVLHPQERRLLGLPIFTLQIHRRRRVIPLPDNVAPAASSRAIQQAA